jgi:hypothetical protein
LEPPVYLVELLFSFKDASGGGVEERIHSA